MDKDVDWGNVVLVVARATCDPFQFLFWHSLLPLLISWLLRIFLLINKVERGTVHVERLLLLARRCPLLELCGAAKPNLESRALVRTSPPV